MSPSTPITWRSRGNISSPSKNGFSGFLIEEASRKARTSCAADVQVLFERASRCTCTRSTRENRLLRMHRDVHFSWPRRLSASTRQP
jgi:hypothetical protein